MYKSYKSTRTPYLTRLFRECINQIVFPDTCKKAKVVTLLKSEEKERANSKSCGLINHLLKIISNFFEKMILAEINEKEYILDTTNCNMALGNRSSPKTLLMRIVEK